MPSTPMIADAGGESVLALRDFAVRFGAGPQGLQVVEGVDLAIGRGEIMGIVGESGSGKSQILLAIMGLLASNGRASGSVKLADREILNLPNREMDQIRGGEMAMIFQDPMTSLTPHLRIGRQLEEILAAHRGMSRKAAHAEAIRMLELVQIPDARRRIDLFPHEFSGGMRQRVMIAMALLCRPALLLADEPTTALDVTVQAQILKLLAGIARVFGTAILIVTHDFGVVASLCQRVTVLYGGAVMESGPTADIVRRPAHPYTKGLIAAMPDLGHPPGTALQAIPGQAKPGGFRPGCAFAARCASCEPLCRSDRPVLQTAGAGRTIACHLTGVAHDW